MARPLPSSMTPICSATIRPISLDLPDNEGGADGGPLNGMEEKTNGLTEDDDLIEDELSDISLLRVAKVSGPQHSILSPHFRVSFSATLTAVATVMDHSKRSTPSDFSFGGG